MFTQTRFYKTFNKTPGVAASADALCWHSSTGALDVVLNIRSDDATLRVRMDAAEAEKLGHELLASAKALRKGLREESADGQGTRSRVSDRTSVD